MSALVLKKKGGNDIFDEQNKKILEIDTMVKEIAAELDFKLDQVNKRMLGIDERSGEVGKTVGFLRGQVDNAHAEFVELKQVYREQCEKFIGEIRKLNEHLNLQVENLEQHCSKLDLIAEKHDNWL